MKTKKKTNTNNGDNDDSGDDSCHNDRELTGQTDERLLPGSSVETASRVVRGDPSLSFTQSLAHSLTLAGVLAAAVRFCL